MTSRGAPGSRRGGTALTERKMGGRSVTRSMCRRVEFRATAGGPVGRPPNERRPSEQRHRPAGTLATATCRTHRRSRLRSPGRARRRRREVDSRRNDPSPLLRRRETPLARHSPTRWASRHRSRPDGDRAGCADEHLTGPAEVDRQRKWRQRERGNRGHEPQANPHVSIDDETGSRSVRPRSTQPLWPPSPMAFESATFTSTSRDSFVT